MKKSTITIITLEILLIIFVVTQSVFHIWEPKNIEYVATQELASGESASLNYLLKYQMPEGYEDAYNLYGEVAITSGDGTYNFTMDILDKSVVTPEDFILSQESLFAQSSVYTILTDDTSTLEDRTITKKIYEIVTDYYSFYALVGIIELNEDSNNFIGVVGTSETNDGEADLDLLLTSTNYTSQTLDKERTFSNDLESVEITVPANWKRLERSLPYSFYKQDDTKVAYLLASSSDTSMEDPKESFAFTVEALLSDETATLIEDSVVSTIGNKTITTSTISYEGQHTTTAITLVEFNNSNIFTMIRTDIVSEDGTDYIMPEINSIIESIELK